MPTEGTMKTLIFGDLSHVRSFVQSYVILSSR